MSISSRDFGLLRGEEVGLLPRSLANYCSSSTSFVWPTRNVELEGIFQNYYYMKRLHSYNLLQSVSNVSYSTGRITRHNQFTRLFTCLLHSSSHSNETAVTIKRRNPNAQYPRTDYSIVTHRSLLQIIQSLIQFEYLSFGPSRSV